MKPRMGKFQAADMFRECKDSTDTLERNGYLISSMHVSLLHESKAQVSMQGHVFQTVQQLTSVPALWHIRCGLYRERLQVGGAYKHGQDEP